MPVFKRASVLLVPIIRFTAFILIVRCPSHNPPLNTAYTRAVLLGTCTLHTGCRSLAFIYEDWNFNSGNYLFTTDTK